jgi:hypothetical protein
MTMLQRLASEADVNASMERIRSELSKPDQ